VTVDQIGGPALESDVAHDLVHEARKVGPEGFLSKVAPGTEGKSNDTRFVREGFEGVELAPVYPWAGDLAGHEIHPGHLGLPGYGPGLVHHIGHLPSRVRVSPQFHLPTPHQTVDAEGHQVHTVSSAECPPVSVHGSNATYVRGRQTGRAPLLLFAGIGPRRTRSRAEA
jgi:hypothetical protein